MNIHSTLTNYYAEKKLETNFYALRHLAKAIGSESQVFVTQDIDLLNLRDKIYDCFQLLIKTPTELIIQLDELSNKSQYQPVRLAGTQLNIIKIGIDREKELVERFCDRETTAEFSQKIRRFITESDRFDCWAICDRNELVALYVYGRHRNYELEIPLLRIEDNYWASTLAYHLIYEATLISAKENRQFTKITDLFLSNKVIEAIQQENTFYKKNNAWLKANFSLVDTKDNVADQGKRKKIIRRKVLF